MSKFRRLEEYNSMTLEQLQKSHIALKQWLKQEYEQEFANRLLLHMPLTIPVDLQDGLNYEVNVDYNLICKGFIGGFTKDTPEQLTIISDIIDTGYYGNPTEVRAPFCVDIREEHFLDSINRLNQLKGLSLPSIKNISHIGNFTLNYLELPALETVNKIKLNINTLELPACNKIESHGFVSSEIKHLSLPQCYYIAEGGLGIHGIDEIELPSNTVYLFNQEESKKTTGVKETEVDKLIELAKKTSTNLKSNYPENLPLIDLTINKPIYLEHTALRSFGIKSKPSLILTVLNSKISKGINITVHPFVLALYLPNCLSLGADSFEFCPTLETLLLPECKKLSKGSISNCEKLQTLYLPNCQIIDPSAIIECRCLKTIYLPVALKKLEDTLHFVKNAKIVYI